MGRDGNFQRDKFHEGTVYNTTDFVFATGRDGRIQRDSVPRRDGTVNNTAGRDGTVIAVFTTGRDGEIKRDFDDAVVEVFCV